MIPKEAIIGNKIQIKASILTHRKVKSGVISFVPIRKNAATGKYEKLLSYDLTITPDYNAREVLGAKHRYATNSILQTGEWYKIAIPGDGVYGA